MIRQLLVIGAAVALSGCASRPSIERTNDLAEKVLGNLQGCSRVYTAAIGGLTPSASLTITCYPVDRVGSRPEQPPAVPF